MEAVLGPPLIIISAASPAEGKDDGALTQGHSGRLRGAEE